MNIFRINISILISFKVKLDAHRRNGTTSSGLIRHLLEQHFHTIPMKGQNGW